jgi:hypothetical protein
MKPESIQEVNSERVDHNKEPDLIRRKPASTDSGKEGFHEKESR